MGLNTIKGTGNWGGAASDLNNNFATITAEIEKLKAANVKFKGYYTSEATLKAVYSSPAIGDNAWVGATYPGTVYECKTVGTWSNTAKAPNTPSVSLADYATKTLLDVRTTEYNVSVQHPTSGIDSTNKYTLSGAVALVPSSLRTVGLKCSFLGDDGKVETWEYQGGGFTNVGSWVQGGTQKFTELSYTTDVFNGRLNPRIGWLSVSSNTATWFNGRYHAIIKVRNGDSVRVSGDTISGGSSFVYLISSSAYELNKQIDYILVKTNNVTVPASHEYLYVYLGDTDAYDRSPNHIYINDIDYLLGVRDRISQNVVDIIKNRDNIAKINTEFTELEKAFQKNNGSINDISNLYNNNNYIRNWANGNKLVKRLYVENKEKAIADGLYIRGVFRNLNFEGNSGFNFGTREIPWYYAFVTKNVEKYERYDNIYGRIAIWFDWDGIEWPSSNNVSISNQSESNLNNIVFDYLEFSNPDYATVKISDNFISENMLNEEVRNKLNNSESALENMLNGSVIASLGDSMSTSGKWQEEVCKWTGMIFNRNYNSQNLSCGGTRTLDASGNCGMDRAVRLLSLIPDVDIIIVQNINDVSTAIGSNEDVPFMLLYNVTSNTIYNSKVDTESNKMVEVGKITRNIGTMLRIGYNKIGYKLTVNGTATTTGNFVVNIGETSYNVHILSTDSISNIISKILEIDYIASGYTDTTSGNNVVVFSDSLNRGQAAPIVVFDANGTGITFTNENANTVQYFAYCFYSYDINEWSTPEKWVDYSKITLNAVYKGLFEFLFTNFPKALTYMTSFPRQPWTKNGRIPLKANGSYDWDRYNQDNIKLCTAQKEIAAYMHVPYIDVPNIWGVNVYNAETYYPEWNVHVNDIGYSRIGRAITKELM